MNGPTTMPATLRARHARLWLRSESLPQAASRGLLVAIAFVAATRAPFVLTSGRFWAEEGAVHFRHMMTSTSPSDLLFVYRRAGYYNLFPNVGTWFASVAPLERAPLITAWLSFGVVALMAWIALSWPSDLLPNAGARIGAATLLVVGTLAQPEVWLTTLHAQAYLAIVVVLLLFVRLDELGRGRYVGGIAILAVAGLSGLYSAALAPLFIVRALQERTARQRSYAVAISAAALVQLLVVFTARESSDLGPGKLTIPGAGEVLRTVSASHVGTLLFGNKIAGALMNRANAGSRLTWIALVMLVVAVCGFLIVLLRHAPKARVPLLLAGALVLVELLVQLGSLGEAGGRYAVVPIAILTLMVIHAATSGYRWLQRAAIGVCVLVLAVGVLQFWTLKPTVLRCIDCPRWDREVREWRNDPSEPLEIWPYDVDTPWAIRLPADTR
jgi:hypothetical protein